MVGYLLGTPLLERPRCFLSDTLHAVGTLGTCCYCSLTMLDSSPAGSTTAATAHSVFPSPGPSTESASPNNGGTNAYGTENGGVGGTDGQGERKKRKKNPRA